MSRDEEDAVRYGELRESTGYDRESACRDAEEQDEEEREDVDGCVVGGFGFRAACWTWSFVGVLPARQFGTEDLEGYIGPL